MIIILQEMHFVMEYMSGGELYKRLSNRKRYSEERVSQVAVAAKDVVHWFWIPNVEPP